MSFIQELGKNNIKTDIIVIDFAKAFNKVPHNRLLSKHLDFLTSRTQTVIIDGVQPEKKLCKILRSPRVNSKTVKVKAYT